jgi:hypothetical protein
MIVEPDAHLAEIVLALGAPGRLAGRLHGRQEQADEYADDRHHHEQFDQGEARDRFRPHGR